MVGGGRGDIDIFLLSRMDFLTHYLLHKNAKVCCIMSLQLSTSTAWKPKVVKLTTTLTHLKHPKQ